MQDSDEIDDEENNITFGGDSYKLRKAAARLGFSLISATPEQFIADLLDGHTHSLELALKDTDEGSKKDILDLMVTIVTTFTEKITPDVYDQWVSLIASQAS